MEPNTVFTNDIESRMPLPPILEMPHFEGNLSPIQYKEIKGLASDHAEIVYPLYIGMSMLESHVLYCEKRIVENRKGIRDVAHSVLKLMAWKDQIEEARIRASGPIKIVKLASVEIGKAMFYIGSAYAVFKMTGRAP